MLRALTTIALLALPGGALAADLATEPPAADFTDPGWTFYVQGYGGVVTQTNATFVEDFGGGGFDTFFDTLGAGPAFGVSVGVTTPIDGLSVGLDVMHTHADFTDRTAASLDTLSIMGTVEGAYHLTPQFDLYATGGLGAMAVQYSDPFITTDGWAPAYQVAVGLRANVTDNLSLFTEFKHQDMIVPANVGDPFFDGTSTTVAKGNNAILAGLRFSFN